MIDWEEYLKNTAEYIDLEKLAYNAGYSVDPDDYGGFALYEDPSKDGLPEITVYTNSDEEEDAVVHTYTVKVNFQDYDSEDATYADDMEFYVKQLWPVAQMVTYISKMSIRFPLV